MNPKAQRYSAILLLILVWPPAVITGLLLLFYGYGATEQAYQQEGLYSAALLLSIWLSAALLFIALVLFGHFVLGNPQHNRPSRQSKVAAGLLLPRLSPLPSHSRWNTATWPAE